jgi:hypothetical protein
MTRSDAFLDFCARSSPGATNRRYLQEDKFLAHSAFVPSELDDQDALCETLEAVSVVSQFGEALFPSVAKQFHSSFRHRFTTSFRTPGAGE